MISSKKETETIVVASQSSVDEDLMLVHEISQVIQDKLGKNIFAIDIRKVSTLCNFCIVAEGTVDRHVKAIAKTVEEELKKKGHNPIKVDGLQEGQWVILDYLNVMVHLLTPQTREKYCLERLWTDGEILELKLDSEPK